MKTNHLGTGLMAGAAVLLVSAPGQVTAQGQSASAAALLEEVVVTARRREESLQDLPLSVAAISGEAMQAQGIYDIKDITEFVPNVAFRDQDRRGRSSLFIRGIGTGGPGAFRPGGAGLYLDGHYMSGNNGQVLSTLDMERVEVLRGPQGTLFGKNTTGGAIQFITAKPQLDAFDSEILLRAADHGQQDFRGMINIPINDTLGTRIALAKETSDGYGFNRNLNTEYGGTDVEAISTALRWVPNENWTMDFLFRGNYEDSDQYAQNCTVHADQSIIDALVADGQGAPGGGAPLDPFGNPYVAAPAATAIGNWGGGGGPGGLGHVERLYPGAVLDFWDNCTASTAAGPYQTAANSVGFLEGDTEFYNVTVDWDSNGEVGPFDNLNVRFIGGRRHQERDDWGDRDATPLQIDSIGSYEQHGRIQDTESLELLFNADVNDRVSFTAGVHSYYDNAQLSHQDCLRTIKANFDRIANDFTLDANGNPVGGTESEPCSFDGGVQFAFLADKTAGGGPVPGAMSGFLENESIAVFGQVNIQLNDDWALDVGARWTEEDRWFNMTEFATVEGTCVYSPAHYLNNPLLPRAPTTGPANPGAPASTEICRPDYLLTYQSAFIDGFYNDVRATFSETTPMISLSRQLAPGDTLDSGMIYGTISEGFLTGAFNDELNVNLVPELAPLLTYGPEFVTNYEFGFKGTLADGRLQIATAIFYMDYTDKQEEIDIDNSDGSFGGDPQIAIVTNAATVDIYGVELELRAQPWDGGFVSFDVGYLDSQYGQFSSFDPNSPGGTVDNSDLTIEDYSPEWTITASVEHAFLLGNGATLTPQLGMYFQTEYDFVGGLSESGGESSICEQDSFATFRFRATYEPADAGWQASLFGSNITDERYYNYCDTSRAGVYDYHYGRPDTWGAEFIMRFGG